MVQNAETLTVHQLPHTTSTPHFSTATPPHRKVDKKIATKFNMDIVYHTFKHQADERNISMLPWMIKLKRRKSGLVDGVTTTTCSTRSNYKLQSICPTGRSSKDNEEWNKILVHSANQARVRAVQMHLNCITTLTALPLTFSCCEKHRPLPAAAAF